jgi:hypothetical protein
MREYVYICLYTVHFYLCVYVFYVCVCLAGQN